MAGVLETLTVPRSSRFHATLAPIGSSSVCALSGDRKPVRVPGFGGLKIRSSYVTRSTGSVSRRLGRRGGRIVCESQDTAVDGKNRPSST